MRKLPVLHCGGGVGGPLTSHFLLHYMTALIVFVKNPIPGAVKTRLQTRYAPDQVAALYTAFVRDVLERAEGIDVDRRVIALIRRCRI